MNWAGIITALILMIAPFFMAGHSDKIEDACALEREKNEQVTKVTLDKN